MPQLLTVPFTFPSVLRDISERGRDLEQILSQYITFVKPAFEEFCLPVSQGSAPMRVLEQGHFVPAQSSDLPPVPSSLSAGSARAGCDGDCLYSHCLPGEITLPFGKAAWPEQSLPGQGLTNLWAAQPGRGDPWLYLAGEWDVSAPRQCLLCLPPLLGYAACPFHPAVLLCSGMWPCRLHFLAAEWPVGQGLPGERKLLWELKTEPRLPGRQGLCGGIYCSPADLHRNSKFADQPLYTFPGSHGEQPVPCFSRLLKQMWYMRIFIFLYEDFGFFILEEVN